MDKMQNTAQVYFVGAGPGAADLITVRGMKLIGQADIVIYAGSLVNPALLDYAREGAEISWLILWIGKRRMILSLTIFQRSVSWTVIPGYTI